MLLNFFNDFDPVVPGFFVNKFHFIVLNQSYKPTEVAKKTEDHFFNKESLLKELGGEVYSLKFFSLPFSIPSHNVQNDKPFGHFSTNFENWVLFIPRSLFETTISNFKSIKLPCKSNRIRCSSFFPSGYYVF